MLLAVRRAETLDGSFSVLTENHRKESLSRAYVQAIAGHAGLNIKLEQNVQQHDYGVDGTIRRISLVDGEREDTGFCLDFQVKATIQWKCEGDDVIYRMKASSYNKIVRQNNRTRALPRILILMCLPRDPTAWLDTDEERLLLRKCSYWKRLVGDPTEDSHCTIRIPRSNRLDSDAVKSLLAKVESGEWQ